MSGPGGGSRAGPLLAKPQFYRRGEIVTGVDLITLSDLPDLPGTEATPKTTITIARLDNRLTDPRYGAFKISQTQVDGWKRNLHGVFGGRVSMDADHSSDRGAGTRAACWITDIGQDGKLVTADVEFTKWGADLVRSKEYLYTSPTFVENYTDEHGQKHGPALIGGALTNRPVLRKGMPTLSLSRDHFDGVAIPSANAKQERKRARRELAKLLAVNSEPVRDSRPQMPDLTELAKLLGLEPDADQVTVLAAVAALKPPSPANAGADAAADAAAAQKASKKAKKLGKKKSKRTMALSAEETADLITAANAGQAAAFQLAEERFDHAWTKALEEGRAAPSQEDTMRALHRKDADLAIKTLDTFVRIVPVKPAGTGEGAATGPAPMGMDEDRYQLHTEAKQLAEQKLRADSNLDEAEAYSLAVIEIDERKFALENPGI